METVYVTVFAVGATSMNWDVSNGWNEASDGSGRAWTNPQNGEYTIGGVTKYYRFTCVLNGRTVAANVNITVDMIRALDASKGQLTVTGANTTRTINAIIEDQIVGAHTMVSVGTSGVGGTHLVLNGMIRQVTAVNSSTAYTVSVNAGVSGNNNRVTLNQVIIINEQNEEIPQNVIELFCTSGTAIQLGAANVTGTINATRKTSNGPILVQHASSTDARVMRTANAAATGIITGAASLTNNTYCITGSSGVIYVDTTTDGWICVNSGAFQAGGQTLNIFGKAATRIITGTETWTSRAHITVSSGTINWTGSCTILPDERMYVTRTGGTLNLATTTGALNLSNGGVLFLVGTFTLSTTTTAAEIVHTNPRAITFLDYARNPLHFGYNRPPHRMAAGTAHWGTLERDTQNGRGGGTCAKLTPRPDAELGRIRPCFWWFYVPTTGSQFKLGFWISKSAAGFNGSLAVSIYNIDNNTLLLTSQSIALPADTTYHYRETNPVTPSGAGLCLVRFELLNGTTAGFLYIDDIAVVPA